MNSTNFARKACALFLCASLSVAAFAQTQIIKGKIVDENGEPLVGVTIQEKGTNNGTITDVDGNYSITAGARSTLQIRYVGYHQEDIAVNGKNVINVNLKSELEDLDEVVVVGYGAVKKRDLTGSVARVGADKLKERSYTNAMQSLQGQVSGVQITQSQGAPGLAPSIKVRGASSVNAGTTPLYVIDGIPLEDNSNSTGTNGGSYDFNRNPMNNINPSDIESIEILKDASSAAIYGSRGANGVVLITTRQGKSGKTKVDVNYEFGISKVLRTMDMMNGPQWIEYESAARRNSYATAAKTNPSLQPSASMANYYVPDEFSDATWLARIGDGTDWQDVVLRTAQTHNAQVSASGGNDKVQFLISTGLVDQDGVVDKTRYKRINVRSNITSQLNKNLKATLNLSFSRSDKVDHGTAGKSDVVSLAVQSDPIFPVRNEVGSLGFKDPSSIWYTFVKYGFQLWHPYSLTRESDKHKEQLN
ncbi:MAG: SusC/RagA family TonB-linked outer membrane protein, partial [Bacteroidales bacterium]|nr:SusC/RagA family TonB-linked outer membrane protein [Bacteroidales bacterium]